MQFERNQLKEQRSEIELEMQLLLHENSQLKAELDDRDKEISKSTIEKNML